MKLIFNLIALGAILIVLWTSALTADIGWPNSFLLVLAGFLFALAIKKWGQKRAKKLGQNPFPPPWRGIDP